MYVISEYFQRQVKLIRDPIYNFIEVPKEFLPVIDNKLFQRLRWVSQLPLEQLVYPSAQHSRFEHSLGTMYLSMLVAITLLNDKISTDRILWAIEEDPNIDLEKLKSEDSKRKFFVTSAGLIGLLHDVGHAPFSHTLEDATKYTKKNIEYNHEKIGYEISKHLVKEYTKIAISDDDIQIKDAIATTVLRVLDKENSLKDLTPLQKILRTIIDSALDVDKGDYVIRDSYHCGVNYGHYGLERLWRHVRVTEDFTLGVSPKGSVEAWSLKLARYKMYKNVYKHHVRNITDALLIRILSQTFDILDEKKIEEILPIDNSKGIDEETTLRFAFWTDNLFLKVLLELEDSSSIGIRPWIEKFMKRELPKKYHSLKLETFGIVEPKKEHYLKIKEALSSINDDFIFLIVKQTLPPVFTRDVQAEIRVVEDSKNEIPLAEYLEFSMKKVTDNLNEDLDRYVEPHYILQIFAPPHTDRGLKQKIDEVLNEILK